MDKCPNCEKKLVEYQVWDLGAIDEDEAITQVVKACEECKTIWLTIEDYA